LQRAPTCSIEHSPVILGPRLDRPDSSSAILGNAASPVLDLTTDTWSCVVARHGTFGVSTRDGIWALGPCICSLNSTLARRRAAIEASVPVGTAQRRGRARD
jgi:hypothetical protein